MNRSAAMRWLAQRCGLVVGALVLVACAGPMSDRDGLALIVDGQYEQGLEKLEEAAKSDPNNVPLRMRLLTTRERVVVQLLATAESARLAGDVREADARYRRVLAISPGDTRASEGLRLLEKRDLHGEMVRQAQAAMKNGDLEHAESQALKILMLSPKHPGATEVLAQVERVRALDGMVPPQLKSRLTKPVSLEFRDANIKMVFDVLSRISGINFLLDKDIKSDTKVTIYVRNVAVEDAIDLTLVQSQLEKKVLSDNSVLIYPNTPQKVREYQDLVVRAFYLVNSEAKQTAVVLKSILKLKDMHVDDRLNMILVRDTPEAIRLAEKVIRVQDLAEPEVLLEIEVLEINRTRALELGVSWPDTFTWLVPDPRNITVADLPFNQHTTASRVGVNSTVLAKLKADSSIANTISNPRIRIKNRDRARVLVGDRVPIITATITPGSTNPVTTESISYLDVGLKLEAEPVVLLDDDVQVKVALEVSTLGESVTTNSGSVAYRVGTRTISTLLRLKDGETQVLMGLIRDEERRTASGVPGLMEMPVLGRLFSIPRDERQKTEIVLSITPRIIRNLTRPDAQEMEFWSGTDANMKARRPVLQSGMATGAVAVTTAAAGTGTGTGTGAATANAAAPALPAPRQDAALPPVARAPESAAAVSAPPVTNTPPAALQPLQVTWQAPPSARVGEQFVVGVQANAPSPLAGAAVSLRFDPSALEVVGVEQGDLLKQGNVENRFNHTTDALGGRLAVSVARPGADGVQGQGRLFNVTFRVKRPAPQSQILLTSMSPLAPDGSPVPFSVSGALSIALQP
ncbi:tetratricopeptide repeat protein [Ramlibacter monticola]|uniref:General secretion pathway protein GspD n=1 Tax=Ramlibacter monticola TaxID=1926872 RepID=A0A937CTU7_9BURK|nr:cohesin domain-containing protein [Ramlibacter monticola]MBL0393000.1 general secretion pathway protein GspD [Ramlibacter monticola]